MNRSPTDTRAMRLDLLSLEGSATTPTGGSSASDNDQAFPAIPWEYVWKRTIVSLSSAGGQARGSHPTAPESSELAPDLGVDAEWGEAAKRNRHRWLEENP